MLNTNGAHTVRGRMAGLAAAGALGLALLAPPALDAQVPAPDQDRAIAIEGATIHTVSGSVIENGTVVFEDGRIIAVGTNVEVPQGAERIDGTGKYVYPGLIHPFTQVGLFEIGGINVTIDTNELGTFNPNVLAETAINPESRHIGVARSAGITTAVPSLSGGLISGQLAAVSLDGWNWEEMTVRRGVVMLVNWPGPQNQNNYNQSLRALRDFVADARAYAGALDAAEAGDASPPATDPRLEAMRSALSGDQRVMVAADDLRQIQDAITWAEEEGLRIVIRGGRDADYLAEELVARDIPVIVTNVLSSPNRQWEPYEHAYSLPVRLHEAGVTFAIGGESAAAYANRLPWHAGAPVAFGLPAEVAIRSVTYDAARILGIDDRVGSIAEGLDANLLLTTGHPLDYGTDIEQIWIEGRTVDMLDQHRQFFEKYSEKIRQKHGGPAR